MHCPVFAFRRDFRLLKGTPGDPLTPELNPVVWFSKYVTSLVREINKTCPGPLLNLVMPNSNAVAFSLFAKYYMVIALILVNIVPRSEAFAALVHCLFRLVRPYSKRTSGYPS